MKVYSGQTYVGKGPDGLEGGLNAGKYIGIIKNSKATDTRDLQQLFEMGAFVLAGHGIRSTSLSFAFILSSTKKGPASAEPLNFSETGPIRQLLLLQEPLPCYSGSP